VKNKVQLRFVKETALGTIGGTPLRAVRGPTMQKVPLVMELVLQMSGTLTLPQLLQMLKDLGQDITVDTLRDLEERVVAGTVQKIQTKGGLLLYRWPAGVSGEGGEGETIDGDELHERLYQRYGIKSFTVSKASKELSLRRDHLESLVVELVSEGRLKEQGMRKFMGHPFQTYKVV
jgi:hypothetical protein